MVAPSFAYREGSAVSQPEPTTWRSVALCRGVTDLFYPPPSVEREQARARRESRALALCDACTVRGECGDAARADRELWNSDAVVAGLRYDDRRPRAQRPPSLLDLLEPPPPPPRQLVMKWNAEAERNARLAAMGDPIPVVDGETARLANVRAGDVLDAEARAYQQQLGI